MSFSHSLTSTSHLDNRHASLGGFPVELWERVIDFIAGDVALSKHLPQCSLACHAWLPRCRHHFVLKATLRSVSDLESFGTFVRASPHQLKKTVRITLGPEDYGGWMAAAPLILPDLPRLEKLCFHGVDFGSQHTGFHQSYSLLHPRQLAIKDCQCREWSQLTRLISFAEPQEICITTNDSSHGDSGTALRGSFELRSRNVRKVEMRASLGELAMCSTWRYSSPLLKGIELWPERWSEKGSAEEVQMWTGVVGLFVNPRHSIPAFEDVRVGFESRPNVALLRDTDTHRRILEIHRSGMNPAQMSHQLACLSSFDPQQVKLKFESLPSPDVIHALDLFLSDPRRFVSLQKLNFCFSGVAYCELRRDGPCVIDHLIAHFPSCAKRGICARICDPDVCPFHEHIRDWEFVVLSIPAAQCRYTDRVGDLFRRGGVPPSIRHRVWSYLADSASERVDGLYARLRQTCLTSASETDAPDLTSKQSETSSHLLVNVLKAYRETEMDAQHDLGLVSIAGFILTQYSMQGNEEDAFWAFASLINILDPHRIHEYATQFAQTLNMQDHVLARRLFVDLGVTSLDLCSNWISTLFIGILPIDHLLLVWDRCMFEGAEVVLRTVMAILGSSQVRRTLLNASSEAVTMEVLTNPPLEENAQDFLAKVREVKLIETIGDCRD